MRKFIIGDIHGCFDELMELLEQVELRDEDLLISVGDIVDRGNKSQEVYEYFAKRPNSVVLMGNHERKHQNQILSFAQEIVKVQMGADYPEFLKWVNGLNYSYETEEAIIVHAFFEHDKTLWEQKQEVLCGSTSGSRYLEKKYPADTYWREYYTGTKPIIYGHHVAGDQPLIAHNTYGIDTGACHGNYLTAIELPGFKIHQVKAKKDYWREEQKKWQIPVLKAKNWEQMSFGDIDKQLQKLAYIEEPEIVAYLAELKAWKTELENTYPAIKNAIDQFTENLIQEHPDDFGMEANKASFRTFIYKSRSQKLTLEDLRKSLDTPHKMVQIKQELSLL